MSSTSLNLSKETVTFKLPSGELIDAIIPGGLSDADAKSYIQMKRPDLLGPPAGMPKPAPMQTVNPVLDTVKSDISAIGQHPGQAIGGALNQGLALATSVLPEAHTGADVDPSIAGLTPEQGKPFDLPGVRSAAASAASQVNKVVHPPQTEAEQAGAHAMNAVATIANAPAVVKGTVAAGKGTVNAVKGALDVKSVQPALQNGVKSVLSDVAEELGVSKPTGTSFRDTAKELGDAVHAKAKEIIAPIDKATNGELTNIDRALDNLNREMRTRVGINKEADVAMTARKAELEAQMQATLDKAKQAGADPNAVDVFRQRYKQAQALYDMDTQIKRAVPYSTDPTKQTANVKGLFSRLNKMLDSGRLGEAVGQERAQQLMQHAEDANMSAEAIKSRVKTAKSVGKGAGLVGGGYLVGDKLVQAYKSLSGH